MSRITPPTSSSIGPALTNSNVTGKYMVVSGQGASTNALGNGSLRAYPIYVPSRITIDRIGCEVTVVGQAGSVVRLGIYTDAGGFPGTPLLDTTVAGDAVATPEATVSLTLSAGWYWAASVTQSAATTQPTLRTATTLTPGYPLLATTAAGVVNNGYIGMTNGAAVTSGALPSWTVAGGGPNTSGAARIFVRLA